MSDKESKKILIIDDDQDLVVFLKTLLEDNGYQTVTAHNGNEGKEQLKAAPDLILLDITMPEKTGVKFYREIKDDPQTRTIPVVMVTGVMKEFEQFIKTRRQVPPPEGYINKPVDQAKLLETIATLLQGNGA